MPETVNEHEVMIRRAVFGKQVEEFVSSEIGRYLLARAAEQRENAQLDFLKVQCDNATAVREIQNRILVADSVVGWLKDAIGDGLQALNILDDRS